MGESFPKLTSQFCFCFRNRWIHNTNKNIYYGPKILPGLQIRIQPIKSGAGNLFKIDVDFLYL